MKTIGMIGGMSWESSKGYYELINREIKKLLGGSHSAKSLMVSVDFAKIEELTFVGNWDEIGRMMAECAQQLEKGGADMIVLCTNTIHLVHETIIKSTDLPFIHIAQATGEAIHQNNIKKVGLLGTSFTMEKEFYKGFLKDHFEIETIIPPKEDRETVHNIIYNELVKGIFTKESRNKCIEIIGRLEESGAMGIILGCTELPLLVSAEDASVPLFDTTTLHATKAVELALNLA